MLKCEDLRRVKKENTFILNISNNTIVRLEQRYQKTII